MATAVAHDGTGEIRSDSLYRLEELKRRAGIGEAAVRTARRNGLRVIYRSRAAWVLGADFIAFITRSE